MLKVLFVCMRVLCRRAIGFYECVGVTVWASVCMGLWLRALGCVSVCV